MKESKELTNFLKYLKENIDEVSLENFDEDTLGDSLEEAKYIGRVRCLQDLAEEVANVPEFKAIQKTSLYVD